MAWLIRFLVLIQVRNEECRERPITMNARRMNASMVVLLPREKAPEPADEALGAC